MEAQEISNSTITHTAVFNLALLTFFSATCHMLGEYIREAAVLALVFIPLDLWKHSEITGARLLECVLFSLIVLGSGMFFEYVSLLCKRIKTRLEEG